MAAKSNSPKFFMQKALDLAKLGVGSVKTNPLVGCVIVKNGKIVATGYHKEFGGPHAEAIALKTAGKNAKGSTVYITLEPCCNFEGKKTLPCVNALIEAQVKKVVIASKDPNPKVSGKSIKLLRENGISVQVGLLESQFNQMNAPYLKFIKTKLPYVFLKVAMSLDGFIWSKSKTLLSSKTSLKFAHKLRASSDAILVGINTILKDDPKLTVRFVKGKNPQRIILDVSLRIPLNAKVLNDSNALVIGSNNKSNLDKKLLLEKKGISVLLLPSKNGKIDLKKLLLELGKQNICTLMVEGGSAIITSFFNENLFDKAYFVITPNILHEGIPMVSSDLKKFPKIRSVSFKSLGKDLLLEAQF
ncbi:bifunctional diaminohydroxyphosphoribosylaminopyrimidine deaminase/5-amino-6-(5-phosphoribosylamino)uracil reductase RibD [Candidatus Micrarchaeota archaeon]|nr:bifunctional diaminohydroxyphosphoribosylaminopyrimidine deaminase/5-amino-6-(5-phosphoribosylamino)uracil reductase RibD [Candidatus Micrarchaeota archaeon]